MRAGLAVRHACTLARVHNTHRRLAPCLRGAAKKSAVVIENATVCARALHDFEGPLIAELNSSRTARRNVLPCA